MNTVESEIKKFEKGLDILAASRYAGTISYIIELAGTKGLGVRYANKLITFFVESI